MAVFNSYVKLPEGSLDARMGPISIAEIPMKYESRKQIQEVYITVFSTFSKVEVLSILVEVVCWGCLISSPE